MSLDETPFPQPPLVPAAGGRRWPLRLQILAPFAALIIVAVSLLSIANAYLAARFTQQQTERQLRHVAETLLARNFPLSQSVLADIGGLTNADYLLADRAGRVVASTLPLVGQSTPPLAGATLPAGHAQWDNARLEPGLVLAGERYWRLSLDLASRPGRSDQGVLHILYPERLLDAARWNAAAPALAIGGMTLLAAMALGVWIARRLSRPIAQLRSQVERLTEADFRAMPLPRRNDELRDLTQSVNALAAELETMRQAIARNERLALLGQLSGGMAHGLRNDVAGARMAVQLHQRHCTSADRESLQVALRQLSLTEENLRRFLSSGDSRPGARLPCDLAEVVQEVVRLLSPRMAHRNVELQTELVPTLGLLPLDRDGLRGALVALVLNALEAAGDDGFVRLETELELRQPTLRVLDSGPGPPPKILAQMFEPFATSKPEGIGLGLAAARRVVEEQGGALTYEPREGMTCYVIRLKESSSAAERQPPAMAPGAVDSTASTSNVSSTKLGREGEALRGAKP